MSPNTEIVESVEFVESGDGGGARGGGEPQDETETRKDGEWGGGPRWSETEKIQRPENKEVEEEAQESLRQKNYKDEDEEEDRDFDSDFYRKSERVENLGWSRSGCLAITSVKTGKIQMRA